MGQVAPTRGARYSYADYLKWDDGERWELFHGVACKMTPASSRKHQAISLELAVQFRVLLRGKRCDIYTAPFDVRLPGPGETDETTSTVVQQAEDRRTENPRQRNVGAT